MLNKQANLDMEVGMQLDDMLAEVSKGMLAERIIEAAGLAAVEHMLQKAQRLRSAVEAENSTMLTREITRDRRQE